MSLRKKDLYHIKPMTVSDLDHIYELELECYEFPWSKNILRDCILYKYDSFYNPPWYGCKPPYTMPQFILYTDHVFHLKELCYKFFSTNFFLFYCTKI